MTGVIRLIERLSAWLVHGRALPLAQVGRLNFLVGCVVVAFITGSVTLLGTMGMDGHLFGNLAVIVYMGVIVGLLLLVRAGVPLRLIEGTELLLVAIFLVFMSVQERAIFVEQFYWFALLPISGGLLLGRQGVWLGCAMALVSVLAVVGLHSAGWTFENATTPSMAYNLVNFTSFLIAVGLLTGVYEALRARAVELAEKEVRRRGEFLATMSHELRTPMNGVLGVAELMSHRELSSEQQENLAIIRRSGEAMVALINDLLDFSKLEAGQLGVESVPLSVSDLANDTAKLFGPSVSERGVTLTTMVEVAVPEWLRGDPLRVRQVLHNLVSNAVKFTSQGGVRVRLRWADDVLSGEVSDDGVGMSATVLSRLFIPFEQADVSTARQHGGTGLGLSISRELCRRMGGDLVAHSVEGKGSTFTFTCRAPRAEAPVLGPHLEGATLTLAGRLLLVEDNAVNQLVARKLCERFGLEVDVVNDGAAAVAQVARAPYALVLMDCQMPVMDGWEATRRIHALPGLSALPIVALTASALAEDLARCVAAGMSTTLTKPIDAARLGAVLAPYFKPSVP